MTVEDELPEPVPLDQPVGGYSDELLTLPLRPLEIPNALEPVDLFGVLRRRRSSREFGLMHANGLASLLYHSAKTLEVSRRAVGPDWEHRPLPSAGGCHAVQMLIVPHFASEHPGGVYDPRAHGCRVIENPTAQAAAIEQLEGMAIKGEPTLLAFFVDPARIAGYYLNWASLVWRDSGVLIGGMALVAAALELKFCPLGFVGTKLVRSFLPMKNVIGVGGCAIGV